MTCEPPTRAGSCATLARLRYGESLTPPHFRRSAIALLALFVFPGCNNASPVAPTAPPATHPNVAIQSISVAGETAASGKTYRVVLHLRETAGVPATIAAVDLTFFKTAVDLTPPFKDPTIITSVHHDQPLPSNVTVCPAGGVTDTRELVTTDPSAANAVMVQATVTFTDGASFTSTASASADVPLLAQPP
jgi:hypothetical protein